MEFTKIIFAFLISAFSAQLIIGVIGTIIYLIGLHKLGHNLIATSIAGDFGLCKKTRKWIYTNCPHKQCNDKCRIWTCENYSKCKKGDIK